MRYKLAKNQLDEIKELKSNIMGLREQIKHMRHKLWKIESIPGKNWDEDVGKLKEIYMPQYPFYTPEELRRYEKAEEIKE